MDVALLDRLPALKVVFSFSSGANGLDVPGRKARCFLFARTSGLLGVDVADLAMTLLLATICQLPAADAYLHSDD